MSTLLVLALMGQVHEYPVIQVLSGEVITIRWHRQAIPIRLLDVQAPNSAARQRLRVLLDGEAVRLDYAHSGPYDSLGRLSAYIYRTSDNLMVNEVLVRSGYAGVSSDTGHRSGRLRKLYASARADHAGLWDGGHPLESEPPTQLAIETRTSTLRHREQYRRELHAAALARQDREDWIFKELYLLEKYSRPGARTSRTNPGNLDSSFGWR